MMRRVPKLDSGRRALIINGRCNVLHEKTWQVMRLLTEHAPGIVSREQIIGQVWSGRSLTGEKGLNQAIWHLRTVLGDDPRNPEFIRTVPRSGYRWIGARPRPLARPRWLLPAGIAATIAAVFVASAFDIERVASRAYLVGPDVHVEFDDGIVAILKNGTNAEIGRPVLSKDGYEIVVPVYEGNGCRLVIVNLSTRKQQDFSGCPARVALATLDQPA